MREKGERERGREGRRHRNEGKRAYLVGKNKENRKMISDEHTKF